MDYELQQCNAIHLACHAISCGASQEVVENTGCAILTEIVPDVRECVKEDC